jgi:hypothetical protein
MRLVWKWWWWKGMLEDEDMNPASAPAWLGCMSGDAKSASAELDPPAMAAMDDRTWQSPNISFLKNLSLALQLPTDQEETN